jgi:hypothetical protein
MKIKIKYSGRKDDPGDEYQAWCEVSVDGQTVAEGGNFAECPEDANLGRDLKFIYKLPSVLRAAYDAGRKGEHFMVNEIINADI